MKTFPLVSIALLGFFLLAPGLAAQEQHYDITVSEDYYTIQFDETSGVPVEDFIYLCKAITGYPIHYNKNEVENQFIHILGIQRIQRDRKSFFEYFQAVMISYEFICSSYGPEEKPYFITIQKMAKAGSKMGIVQAQAPVISRDELDQYKDNPGMLITTTIPLKYIEAREMQTSLNQFFQGMGNLESIRASQNANSLIITGFATKIWGVSKLVTLMDVEPFEIEVATEKRELRYAVADELEPVLTNLVTATQNVRPGGQPTARVSGVLREPETKILAEPRTNSLLYTGSQKVVDQISDWIDILDVEVDPRGDIHVYRLKNTLADDMTTVLQAIIDGQEQSSTTRRPTGTQPSGIQPGNLEAPASVVSDPASNSLIITASKTRYAQLQEVIKKLDIRRKQVLIECAAVELTQTLKEALGVELAGLDLKVDADGNLITDNYARPFGFTSFGLSEITGDPKTGYQRTPNFGTGFTGGIFNGQDFAIPFILNALSRTDDANILSMPSILTNDNEEALVKSIDERPSTATTMSGGTATQQDFSGYQEAGITLSISPSISAGNYLKLHIRVDVSRFTGSAGPSGVPPRATREIETDVTIPDGHTMIVGGVLEDSSTESVTKVPFLGDLPFLGWLFRSTDELTTKINLYVFITPHIIGDDFANLDDISFEKKKEVEALTGKVLLIDPDFEHSSADERIIDAGINAVFEIPSYAEPDTGEVDPEYVKTDDEETDTRGEQ